MKDWKTLEVQPDEGFYTQIVHRLRVRRAWRISGIVAGAVIVASVSALVLWPKPQENEVVAYVQPASETVAPSVSEETAVAQVAEVPLEAAAPEEKSQPSPVAASDGSNAVVSASAAAATQAAVETAVALPQPVLQPAKGSEVVALGQEAKPVQPTASMVVPVAEEEAVRTDAPKAGTPTSSTTPDEGIIWAPNIIAMGDEKVENHYFKVVPTSPVSEFKIYIYNRGGRLVYKSSDISEQWDATHSGTPVPQGAYVWVATFRDASGKAHKESGTVTVVR